MELITLEQVRNKIMSEVPQCPEGFVRVTLIDVAKQFFQNYDVWTKEIQGIDIVSGQAAYRLNVSEAGGTPEISRILEAKNKGSLIYPENYVLSYEEENGLFYYTLEFKSQYVPQESEEDALSVTVSLFPNLETGYINPFILNRWWPALYTGTVFVLKSMRNKPWADLESAVFWEEKFVNQQNLARKEYFRNFVGTGELRAYNPGGWL